MSVRQYKVSDLRRIISESTREFNPVLGTNVNSDNKKNNEKAYKDMLNAVKDYDGSVVERPHKTHYLPNDDNRGMQDLTYDNLTDEAIDNLKNSNEHNKATKNSFKERVKSQMKGYVSADAEKRHKNDDYGNAEFTEMSNVGDKSKKLKKGKMLGKEIGLTTRELDKNELEGQSTSVFEGKMPKLKFKNTSFLTEQHMLSKVPDEFKIEGNKFSMKDKNNAEYIVEWGETPKVVAVTKINEQQNRIKELFAYKGGEAKTSGKSRIFEQNNVEEMVNKTRKLIK